MIELLPYSAKVPGSMLTPGADCVEFARSRCDHVGCVRVLQLPLTTQRQVGL